VTQAQAVGWRLELLRGTFALLVVLGLVSGACGRPAASSSADSPQAGSEIPQEPGAWLGSDRRPTAVAREALALLAAAAAEGLDPADYDAAALSARADAVSAGDSAPERAAAFEADLTGAVARYLQHLHQGRVNPRDFGFKLDDRVDEHDYDALAREAVAGGRLAATVAELTPPLQIYRNLRTQLAVYRRLADDASLVAPPAPPASVRPGEPYDGAVELRRMLAALGDLPSGSVAREPGIYDDELADAVGRFQRRHGLSDDGVLGRATGEALRVPLSTRLRQIELSLERLRWLPHVNAAPLVAVNIPMFRMWGWRDPLADTTPDIEMGVIVGQALRNQTPVFAELMRSVVFRPYWNVPASIVTGEILPAVARDPDYLPKSDMELVAGQSDASPVVPASPENIERLRRGELRLRQRPGPGNSLGLAKFVFPNDDAVYMHGTPAQQLFSRSRRDFSHGCIRVEDPVALAEWVLRDRGTTREQVLAAMAGPSNQQVPLPRDVQVVLFYMTAIVRPDDGSVWFAEDIYLGDQALDRALREKRYAR
jgi:murein L,D-transpeptidase YcbB/YkuD